MPQQPLQMPITTPRLKLWLHMSTKIRLRPHQPPLKMLHPHRPLRILKAERISVIHERLLILQIREGDHDRCLRLGVEPESSAPCHILDGEERSLGYDHEVEVCVGDENALGGVDDLGEDFADWIGGGVATDEHGT